jgi:hypothetical protein
VGQPPAKVNVNEKEGTKVMEQLLARADTNESKGSKVVGQALRIQGVGCNNATIALCNASNRAYCNVYMHYNRCYGACGPSGGLDFWRIRGSSLRHTVL